MALVGPGGCGKSALAVRMLSRRFISEYSPVLEDTYSRTINNGGLQVSLEVMDTSEGQGDIFHDDGTVSSCVGARRDPARWSDWADIVLVVYSVTNRASLTACRAFLQHCQPSEPTEAATQPTVIAVGNKNDLQMLRTVSLSEASGELGSAVADIVETSAAEDQDSVDILLATALKVGFPLNICLYLNRKNRNTCTRPPDCFQNLPRRFLC